VHTNANRTLSLPHLLRIFGPSSLTPYKHVAAAMYFEDQIAVESSKVHLCAGVKEEGINVLSVITLYDINLQPRTSPGRTDAVLPPIPLFFCSYPRVNHINDDGACWTTWVLESLCF
jgi:hypothetical protein